jgi:hypothetical protein
MCCVVVVQCHPYLEDAELSSVFDFWVLTMQLSDAQSFPFASIELRFSSRIKSTLPGLGVKLTADEVAWLNLEG